MPSVLSSTHRTLSKFLGQRRLLGFGALVAWLILFHLLVNVWLLCIFTSLLVVLGGWLLSRVALDANSLLHLEHFLPLGKVTPPLHSPEHEWRLDHEIHCAVHKAVQDFVSSWYRTLLPEEEGEFECAVRSSMLESVMELKRRARHVDRKALVQRLLELYGCHLQSYMTVRQMKARRGNCSLWKLYSEVDAPHPAVSSASAELSYSRALVNLVLHVLVPYPEMETRTGAYVVTELITCNVLLPLLNRVSDPDWLNQTIVDLFTRSREAQEISMEQLPAAALYMYQNQQECWTTGCSLSSEHAGLLSKNIPDPNDLQSPACHRDSSWGSMVSLTSSGREESCHSGLLPPCRVNCFYPESDQDSNSSECKIFSVESLTQSEEDQPGGFCDCGPPANLCNVITLTDDEATGCFAPLKAFGPKAMVVPEASQWPAGIAQENPPVCPQRKLCLTSYNFQTPNHPLIPVRIKNIQIVRTVTAKEQRGNSTHAYTLYTVKFETLIQSESSSSSSSPAVCHTVDRRYSEFLNLQTRLEEKPEFKKFIKTIKGPKKLFPDLTFGSADSERIEVRKGQLDTFLKQLSSIPEIAQSEDMQEFLALNTDTCTYFERKPFIKSRLDKMMENALDTLKTAFPHPEPPSPTEDMDGEAEGRAADSRKYRRLRFPSKVSPSLNMPDLHPKVTYCSMTGSPVLNGMSLSGLESFVHEQEKLLCGTNRKDCLGAAKPSKQERTSGTGRDTAVADVALNILCLLMKDQWSWLCTENIQKTIRLLFGTFIERWVDVGVAHLTSATCWVIYLQVLQEAVWPGGTLPAQPRQEPSAAQRHQTKERCLECLMQLLPEMVTDILGTHKYRLSLETVQDSLQDHHINKHLLYCICDLLLEFLVPESCDESFQTSLLQSLTKDAEKGEPSHVSSTTRTL
ncbi:sorting nexin-19a [Genypterus blacodes]|uniref:sorting nexin-19a n=1 Tax=Genypterus blacodes TaxID=154954 RepID=UPI003F766FD0